MSNNHGENKVKTKRSGLFAAKSQTASIEEEEENEKEGRSYARVKAGAKKQHRLYDDEEVHKKGTESEVDEDSEAENKKTRHSTDSRKSTILPGSPAEAGIIKQVYVENFMCHQKLNVDLCRNVNFIIGQNGSGKSAILAAIRICLGAAARSTGRGRSLQDLILKGAAGNAPSYAKIRVSLSNMGSDAYKPEIYGDTITVERTISARGGSVGYNLLDKDGIERSKSKKDVDAMLDQL